MNKKVLVLKNKLRTLLCFFILQMFSSFFTIQNKLQNLDSLFFCLSCLHSNNCLTTFLYFSKQGAEKEDETAEDAQEEDVEDIEHEEEENEAEEEANDDMQENDEETALIDELGNYFINQN